MKPLRIEDIRVKAIPGYEKYVISDNGVVWSLEHGRVLKQETNHKGYYVVTLYDKELVRKTQLVHRLIMKTFVGDSPLTVNHIDGNKENNYIGNLEYISNEENLKHSNEVLQTKRGHKLSVEDVKKIRQLHKTGSSQRDIARQFKIHQGTVYHIIAGRTWKWVEG